MVEKLKESEQEVLLSKYKSMGLTKEQAARRLGFVLGAMVVSSLTIIH